VRSISITAVLILVIVSIAAFAQEPKELFGNADFPPNGYIYFSGLPTPPKFPAGTGGCWHATKHLWPILEPAVGFENGPRMVCIEIRSIQH
jgi:hypothetical protein